MAKEALPYVVEEFADGVLKAMQASEGLGTEWDVPFDAVHANYWLSGLAGHIIKHRLNLPLVSTFHTLDRVKAEASPEEVEADEPHRRAEAEATIIRCSDTVLASCSVEAAQISELYGADPDPDPDRGPRRGPRLLRPRGPHPGPSGPRTARRGPAAAVRRSDPTAEGCGGGRTHPGRPPARPPRRPAGDRGWAERAPGRGRAGQDGRRWWTELGLAGRVVFVPPQPHELLSTYYRAATSAWSRAGPSPSAWWRSRRRPAGHRWWRPTSGGLRSLIDHGRTGYLVEDPSPEAFAAWVRQILAEPLLAERLSTGAVLRARRYTWARAAHLLREIYGDLTAGRLVECS